MITLNLLPDVKRQYIKTRRTYARVISLSILSSIVAIGITVLLVVWVYVVQQVHIGLVTDTIKKRETQLESIKDVSKYVTVQNQLTNLSTLHDEKNDFSRLFAFLPQLNPTTPDNVKLGTVAVNDADGTITMQGSTSSYTGLVKFRDILQKANVKYKTPGSEESSEEALFSSVIVAEQAMSASVDASNPGSQVTFKIIVTYAKPAFAYLSSDVSVSVPTLETTPSKRDVPDIFSGGGE